MTEVRSFLERLFGIFMPRRKTCLGVDFQTYPIQANVRDYNAIMQGATDVTGQKWAVCNRGYPCWNSAEMGGPFEATGPDDPELDRIRNYAGPLRSNPKMWPEPYRTAYLDSH